jgi:hypothetical protein
VISIERKVSFHFLLRSFSPSPSSHPSLLFIWDSHTSGRLASVTLNLTSPLPPPPFSPLCYFQARLSSRLALLQRQSHQSRHHLIQSERVRTRLLERQHRSITKMKFASSSSSYSSTSGAAVLVAAALLSAWPVQATPFFKRATVCNGDSALCSRLYSNVTFIGSHDSYAVSSSSSECPALS